MSDEEDMELTHRNYPFAAVIERDADGYFAWCPILQGCCTQGETFEEALKNQKSAIKLVVEDMLDCGEELPLEKSMAVVKEK